MNTTYHSHDPVPCPPRPRSHSRPGVFATIMCSLLLALALPAPAATFDVTDYGAVGDDSTDNTKAFSACLNDLVTGYDTGIVVNEHTDADHIVVASNAISTASGSTPPTTPRGSAGSAPTATPITSPSRGGTGFSSTR